jgi:hypothetical protein
MVAPDANDPNRTLTVVTAALGSYGLRCAKARVSSTTSSYGSVQQTPPSGPCNDVAH